MVRFARFFKTGRCPQPYPPQPFPNTRFQFAGIAVPSLALLLTLGLGACATDPIAQESAGIDTPPLSSPTIAATPSPDPTPSPPPSPLPPATAAIVARLGTPPFNPPKGDLRFAVISDLNQAYGSTTYDPEVAETVALLPYWQPDLVLGGGDMVAGQSLSLSVAEIQAMWAAFDRIVAAPLRQGGIPFGFTLGNHDGSGAPNGSGGYTFQRDRDLAAQYWRDPRHDPGITWVDRGQFPFYYTFTQGQAFFLVWDGSTSEISPAQLAWVKTALQSPAAQSAASRILVSHLPLYAVAAGRNKPGEVMTQADDLRAMLEQFHVNTYVSGHHHAYYPGQRGTLDLLHAGLIGSGPRALIDQPNPSPKTLTLVDLDYGTGQTTYTTYNAETWQTIALASLPRFLLGHNGRVRRRDLEASDLTPAEENLCVQRLGSDRCEP